MNMNRTFFKLLFLVIFISLLGFFGVWRPALSAANGKIQISPAIIDENAQASGLFEYSINIKNGSDSRVELYALVRDMKDQETASSSNQSDRSVSLASWVSFFRGSIVLVPGEERIFPLKIKISPNAAIGIYYSEIIFGNGSNITDAEENARNENAPKLLLRFSIAKKIVELAQITSFAPEKSMFFSMPLSFLYEVSNNGTTNIKPRGLITLYDRRGKEVASLPVRETEVNAGKKENYRTSFDDFSQYGKFKAKATLEYGDVSIRNMENITEFWVLPWNYLSVFAGCALFLLFIFIYSISKRNTKNKAAISGKKPIRPKILDLKDKS
jgi:hypothetical protein